VSLKDVGSRSAAAAFIGKKVSFRTSSGKEIVGKISAPHGNGGTLRARFSKGVPGMLLGKEIEIQE
jgi:large subunit ribosomal protein L35Ae